MKSKRHNCEVEYSGNRKNRPLMRKGFKVFAIVLATFYFLNQKDHSNKKGAHCSAISRGLSQSVLNV